ITVSNSSNANVASAGVVVTDQLAAGLTFSPAGSSAGCAVNGSGLVTCPVGSVGANQAVTVTVVATTAANTTPSSPSFVNSASLSATSGNDNSGNDSSNTVTTTQAGVAGATDLAITKSGPASAPQAGGSVFRTITVTNTTNANVASAGVVVSDQLAAGLTF